MSTPQPPPPNAAAQAAAAADYARTLHNVALATAIACPLIALLPPRKLDLFTLTLGGTSVYSINYLVRESTHRSILQHLSGRGTHVGVHSVPRIDETSSAVPDVVRQHTQEALRTVKAENGPSVTAEVQAARDSKDWVVERDKDVQEALDVGKGFGDMIMDQIYEVVNWGKKRDDDDD
ncbi:hypothetical protein B0A48_00109 [Cryoendolithus antarcticus]|uniref:Uncharacterized protein n=1 Tax=Cryoendolithus antarcticus TaxID=1507870 RepID=A0A1V8TTS5_9PEZI|nr:hypothetical protein B0A48_00109 [Cryoendolithus antarcticus]